jgi:hypothetical protein
MPDGVDATVDLQQLTALAATIDPVLADADVQKLPTRNHPVLPSRQVREHLVDTESLAASTGHRPVNAGRVPDSPPARKRGSSPPVPPLALIP